MKISGFLLMVLASVNAGLVVGNLTHLTTGIGAAAVVLCFGMAILEALE